MPQQMERGKTRLNKGGGNEQNTHIAACTPTTWFLRKQPVMCRKHDQKTPQKVHCSFTYCSWIPWAKMTSKCSCSPLSPPSWSACPGRCFHGAYLRATLVRLRLQDLRIAVCIPRRGEKKNPLEITMTCCCHGSKWTESSACRATLELLLREQSTVAPLQCSIFILLQQSGAFPGRPTTKQSTGNLKI